jgi:hypothetical protein
MRLIAGHDAHAPKGGSQRRFIRRGDLVVLTGNYLLIVGIGPFDQAGEDLSGAGPESEMIFAAGNLHCLIGVEQAPDLLQRLGRHDEIGLGGSTRLGGGHIHACQTVAVRGHHAHALGPKLPEHAVQNRTAFLGAGREGHMPNQLLELSG